LREFSPKLAAAQEIPKLVAEGKGGERIKMPKRGGELGFSKKLNARNKSYKPEFTPSLLVFLESLPIQSFAP
jgi:hypothetical protein